jgi:hypothetical protein
VVTGLPTSFVDLLDKTIDAAKAFTPLDAAAVEKLQQMAANRESLFTGEERQVAFNLPHRESGYAYSPHEDPGVHSTA